MLWPPAFYLSLEVGRFNRLMSQWAVSALEIILHMWETFIDLIMVEEQERNWIRSFFKNKTWKIWLLSYPKFYFELAFAQCKTFWSRPRERSMFSAAFGDRPSHHHYKICKVRSKQRWGTSVSSLRVNGAFAHGTEMEVMYTLGDYCNSDPSYTNQ